MPRFASSSKTYNWTITLSQLSQKTIKLQLMLASAWVEKFMEKPWHVWTVRKVSSCMRHKIGQGNVKSVRSSRNALALILLHQRRLTGDLHQALQTISSVWTLMLALEETMKSHWEYVQRVTAAYCALTASTDTSDLVLLNVTSAVVLLWVSWLAVCTS